MSIQKMKFSNGGFVLHRIQGDFSGKVSAWFDDIGELLDAEQILPSRQCRPIKRNGPIWQQCEQWGRIHRDLLPIGSRCERCRNCLQIAKNKSMALLGLAKKPGSGDAIASAWNDAIAAFPCENAEQIESVNCLDGWRYRLHSDSQIFQSAKYIQLNEKIRFEFIRQIKNFRENRPNDIIFTNGIFNIPATI